MKSVLGSMVSIRPWQVLTLVIVLFAAAGAAYGAYTLVDDSGEAELGEGRQLVPVQFGNLVNEVSVNGTLLYPDRETLTFGTRGVVTEVLVEEGQVVEKGHPLARLDAETVTTLEEAIAQARVNLRDAQESLDEARNPHTLLDVAQAEADVAGSAVALKSAREALKQLQETDTRAVAKAEAAVSSADLALRDARDTLDSLLNPAPEPVVRAETEVIDETLSLVRARQFLETLMEGPTEDELAQAASRIDSARTILANAVRDHTLTEAEWGGKVRSAQEALQETSKGYAEAFRKWLGLEPTAEEALISPDALFKRWKLDLAAVFDPTARYDDLGRFIHTSGLPQDDPETAWSESTIYIWLNLFPGNVVAVCDDGPAAMDLCVMKEIDDAWSLHSDAIEIAETVETQAATALAAAELKLSDTQDDLTAAQDGLANLHEPPDTLDVEDSRLQVTLAEAALQAAEQDLAELLDDSDPLEEDALIKQVALEEATALRAREDLAELQGGADPIEVEARRKDIAVAEAKLAQSESDLAELRGSVDTLLVALREAALVSAEAALEAAVQGLEDATPVAPWDGIVSAVNVEVGQEVNANTPAFEVVAPTTVEVDGAVDEIDVLFIRESARAQVTMDALPGQVLEGTVSAVAIAAQSQQGVVSYPMRIRVAVPQGMQLPEGLSAVASVVIREDRDVLLVPLQAIYGTFDQPLVRVSNGDRIEERAVVLGNNDDFWAVVEEGLAEAELVVMESQQASTGGFGFGAFGGGFRRFPGQGGFSGGGDRGRGQGGQPRQNR